MDAEWFARIEAEHRAGNLGRAERDVLRALGRLLAVGEDEPSEARLVSESGCSRRTVQRAKAKARELKLLDWETRHQRTDGRVRRLPCRYRAEMPVHAVSCVKRHGGAGKVREEGMLRSVRAQIAALPPVTPEMLAIQHARRVRLGLATR